MELDMFRRIALIVLVLGLALSVTVTPAAAKTETLHFRFQGQSAFASFSTFDETGCIHTFVRLFAQDGRVKQDGRPEVESMAIVNISQVNDCTYEFLLLAIGFTALAPDEFVIDKKLNQATLTTTIVVEDTIISMTFPVDINVTWTGIGETSTVKEHFQIKEPGLKENFRFMGISRGAQASGTVTGLGTNFTPEPTTIANMRAETSGDVTIFHDV
jgi:hypothetical protein